MTEHSPTSTWSPGWGPPSVALREEYPAVAGEERIQFLGRSTLLVAPERLTLRPGDAMAASELGVEFAPTNRKTAELQEENRSRAMARVFQAFGVARWRWIDHRGRDWRDSVRTLIGVLWDDLEAKISEAQRLAHDSGTEILVTWSRPSASLQVEARSYFRRQLVRRIAGERKAQWWEDVALYLVEPDGATTLVVGETFVDARSGDTP